MQGEASLGVRALSAVAWVVGALAVLLISALIHVHHPVVRRLVGRALEQAVTSGSPGILRIGSVDDASFARLVVSNVRFWDLAEKRRALDLDHVEVDLDPTSLMSDTIHVLRIRVRGGHLVLQKSWKRPPDGFMPKLAAPPGLVRRGKHLRVDEIAFDGLDVVAVLDAAPYELQALSGKGSVSIDKWVVVRLSQLSCTLKLPGNAGTVGLGPVSGTIPFAPEAAGLARAAGTVRVQGQPAHAELTYADRNEPPPLQVAVSSESFGKSQLVALGLPSAVLASARGAGAPYSGTVRYAGTFRTAEVTPDLQGVDGERLQIAQPVALEASWKLPRSSAALPEPPRGLTAPLIFYVFLTVLLAAIVIVQVAMMLWLQRRSGQGPWWRMLPVATSVAVWIQGGRLQAAVWWVLVALYVALAIGAA